MEATERLACLMAMKKAVDTELSLARGECNDELAGLAESAHVEKRALLVDGVKVGEHAVTYSSAGFEVENPDAFEDFALCNGLARIVERVEYLDGWQRCVEAVGGKVLVKGTDVEVPGVRYVPRHASGTRVTGCKPAEVLPLLRGVEGGAQALLEGKEL